MDKAKAVRKGEALDWGQISSLFTNQFTRINRQNDRWAISRWSC